MCTCVLRSAWPLVTCHCVCVCVLHSRAHVGSSRRAFKMSYCLDELFTTSTMCKPYPPSGHVLCSVGDHVTFLALPLPPATQTSPRLSWRELTASALSVVRRWSASARGCLAGTSSTPLASAPGSNGSSSAQPAAPACRVLAQNSR